MDDYRLQDPSASIDHPIDWEDWLQPGEVVYGADFSITPDDSPTLLSTDSPYFSDTTTSVTVSNLTVGQIYRLSHTITTSAGRIDTRSLTIRCFPE